MVSATHLLSACLVLVAAKYTVAVELTFELADNAHECFYQDIDKGTSVTLEFQVCPIGPGALFKCFRNGNIPVTCPN